MKHAYRKIGRTHTLFAGAFSVCSGTARTGEIVLENRKLPAWIFAKKGEESSLTATIDHLPAGCSAVRVETVIRNTSGAAPGLGDVYRLTLSQNSPSKPETSRLVKGAFIRSFVPEKKDSDRTIELESCYPVDCKRKLHLKIERRINDVNDSFAGDTLLVMLKVTFLTGLRRSRDIQAKPGYNSWPVIQALGDKLICVYSCGKGHSISEHERGVYARTSADGGKTWTREVEVSNDPGECEVTIGKGLDSKGNVLIFVRCLGGKKGWHHDLYRTGDGMKFEKIAVLDKLSPMPMQITDIFRVPDVGLMALWFGGSYSNNPDNAWGTLVSRDDGKTWKQTVVEDKLRRPEYPTEPSAVYVGNGRIFAIARAEWVDCGSEMAQFQLESADNGKTWKKYKTNITDVMCSTPSLVYDPETGFVSNYYFYRGRGLLKRRCAKLEDVSGHPLNWPEPEMLAIAEMRPWDTGNVNATSAGGRHYAAYYTGKHPHCRVVFTAAAVPEKGK